MLSHASYYIWTGPGGKGTRVELEPESSSLLGRDHKEGKTIKRLREDRKGEQRKREI